MEVSVFSRSDGHVRYVGPVISAVFAEIPSPPISIKDTRSPIGLSL